MLCKKQNFNSDKTSTLLGIFIKTFDKAMKYRMDNDAAFQLFKSLVLNHLIDRPPYSIVVFFIDDLKVILDFALHSFFRNFSLYRYTFTPHLDMVVSCYTKGDSARESPINEAEEG
jgi:hypothetical protein